MTNAKTMAKSSPIINIISRSLFMPYSTCVMPNSLSVDFYQLTAISSCVGLRFANVPVSHTIPVPSDVSTRDPLGLVFRSAATMI